MQRPHIFLILLLVVLLAAIAPGCGESTRSSEETGEVPNPDLAEGRHVFLAADQAEVPYVVSGAGDTTVVLVHCWMCERSFWDAQIPALRDTYRVIALDLPGHGEGGDTRETWTLAGYGEDVAGLIEHLGLDRVVLVGHSMGGPVALRAAALAGGRVVGIVAVDTLHDADFDFAQPMVEQMVAAFQNDFRGVCTNFVEQMFVEEDVDEIVDEVRRVGCKESNAEAGKALMQDFATLDFPTLFREAGVPIRAINAAAPNPTQIETNRQYSDFDAVLMEEVGHYLHMTRPEEFNGLLLQTLEQMP
jgi:pimeloyl-ACP methyl ester carboxylesterase